MSPPFLVPDSSFCHYSFHNVALRDLRIDNLYVMSSNQCYANKEELVINPFMIHKKARYPSLPDFKSFGLVVEEKEV